MVALYIRHQIIIEVLAIFYITVHFSIILCLKDQMQCGDGGFGLQKQAMAEMSEIKQKIYKNTHETTHKGNYHNNFSPW